MEVLPTLCHIDIKLYIGILLLSLGMVLYVRRGL